MLKNYGEISFLGIQNMLNLSLCELTKSMCLRYIITYSKQICQDRAVGFPSTVDNLVNCRGWETPVCILFDIHWVIHEKSTTLRNVIEYG